MNDDKDLMTLKTTLSEPVQHQVDGEPTSDQPTQHQPPRDGGLPLMGIFAVIFGLLSIFSFAPLFAPLGVIFGIIALFMGQVLLGISAIGLAVIGAVTSPAVLAIASLGAFFAWLGL
ncbi:MAG: hypothetical protein JKY92_03615 [Magnetovibrio sp.]|nr:hypothetical protein [Magnetovibrio sp.]